MHPSQALQSNGTKAEEAKPANVPIDPEYTRVPTARLLEPLNPARTEMDEVEMQNLCWSIERLGIIQPLAVEREGDNFRVHAGHRRLIAARLLNLETVPVAIYPAGRARGQAIKSHENYFREALNVAQEAQHFAELLETDCENDVDKLCALVCQTRGYVESRVLLFAGDQKVYEALARGEIGMGVAQELNKVKKLERRRHYLDAAIRSGSAVRVVRDWRTQGNLQDEMYPNGDINVELPESPNKPVTPIVGTCVFCQRHDQPETFEILYAHKFCLQAAERRQPPPTV